jgi:hypothetical protein
MTGCGQGGGEPAGHRGPDRQVSLTQAIVVPRHAVMRCQQVNVAVRQLRGGPPLQSASVLAEVAALPDRRGEGVGRYVPPPPDFSTTNAFMAEYLKAQARGPTGTYPLTE